MKRRIIASTMASVMALSAAGTSLVSFAEIDAAYKNVQSVTKAELRQFLKTDRIVKLVDGDVDNYGSVSGERFMLAYQFAESVLDTTYDTDAEADAAATTAFQMLKATEARLVTYTAKQLAALVETCKPTYDSDNQLNPNSSENEDMIYNGDDWSLFSEKYEDAEDYVNYDGDIRITTDAYEELQKAYEDLTELATVKKTELTAAMKRYETALKKEFDYQPWQRGSVKNAKEASDYKDLEFAWGALYQHAQSGYTELKNIYDDFIEIRGINKTSNSDIVNAVKAMNMAANLIESFVVDPFEAGNQRKVVKLLGDYQGRMVYDYNQTAATAVFDSFKAVTASLAASVKDPEYYNGNEWVDLGTATVDDAWVVDESDPAKVKTLGKESSDKYSKVLAADLSVRSAKASLWYVVDKDNTCLNGDPSIVPINRAAGTVYFSTTKIDDSSWSDADKLQYKVVELTKSRTLVISDLIRVTSDNITAANAAFGSDITSLESAFNSASTTLDSAEASHAALVSAVISLKKELYTPEVEADNEADPPVSAASATGKLVTAITNLEAQITALDAASAWDNATDALASDGATVPSFLTAVKTAASNLSASAKTYKTELETYRDNLWDDDFEFTDASVAALSDTSASSTAAYKDYAAKCVALASAITAAKDTTTADTGIDNGTAATIPAGIDGAKAEATGTGTTIAVTGSSTVIDTAVSAVENDSTYNDAKEAFDTAKTALDNAKKASTNGLDADNYKRNTVFEKNEVTNGTFKKGLVLKDDDNDWATTFHFTLQSLYSTSKTGQSESGNRCSFTTVDIQKAVELVEIFNADSDKNDETYRTWGDEAKALDNINDIVKPDNDAVPSSPAWKLVYNYLAYALSDAYDASAKKTYKKKDVEDYVEKAYEIAELTAETAMFNESHAALVSARKTAENWLKLADNNRRTYKDNYSVYLNVDSTGECELIKDKYDQLKAEYDGFKYSYQDLINEVSKAGKLVDGGTLNKTASDKIVAAIDDVAIKLARIEKVVDKNGDEINNDPIFGDDGALDVNDRIMSTDGPKIVIGGTKVELGKGKKNTDPNNEHWVLTEAIDNLKKVVEEATSTPTTPKAPSADVNGDGTITMLDLTAAIQLYADNNRDTAKLDFNTDGKVDMTDLTRLIQDYADGKLTL